MKTLPEGFGAKRTILVTGTDEGKLNWGPLRKTLKDMLRDGEQCAFCYYKRPWGQMRLLPQGLGRDIVKEKEYRW